MAWMNVYKGGAKKSKYGAEKTVTDGMKFDSKREARRWCDLKVLEKAGIIKNLERQVKFVLIPAQYGPDKTGPKGGRIRGRLIEREVAYVADFVYWENGQRVVEDAKGMRTPDYVIKRKMMLYFHKIQIREV